MNRATEIVGKFARIASDAYGEYGLNRGDIVAIAGSGFAPVDENDNYKLLFVVSKYDDGKIEDKGTALTRESIELLPNEESDKLMATLAEKVKIEDGAQEAANEEQQVH